MCAKIYKAIGSFNIKMIVMNIPDKVKQKMQTLINSGFEAYIIGGACRDSLMGRVPNDYDLFTDATGGEILNLFPNGVVIGNDDRQKKILTVIVDGIEISQYRKSGDRLETQ